MGGVVRAALAAVEKVDHRWRRLASVTGRVENDPNLALAVLAVAVAGLTLAFMLVQAWRTRPRNPPEAMPTMDLLDEPPPAIVDLVTDDFEVTPGAVPATLCDLAARRWLAIEELSPGNVVIRIRGRDGRGELLDYERQVLDHVRGLAVDGVVPAKAMTTGPSAVSQRWWRRLRDAVVADAQRRGLCRDRWTGVSLFPAALGALATFLAVYLAVELGEERPSGQRMTRDEVTALVLVAAAIAIALGIGVWLGRIQRTKPQRDTAAGLQMASHWLGVRRWMSDVGRFGDKPAASVLLWDKYLGYAIALDLARTATTELPLGAEDDRHAWSRATGRWRHVRVRYPRLRPGWGRHPFWAVVQALLVGGAALFVLRIALQIRGDEVTSLDELSREIQRYVDLGALVVAVVLVPVVLWNVVKLWRGLIDLFDTRTIEGEVVRKRVRGGSDDKQPRRYLAVDSGDSSTVRAWDATAAAYAACAQGDRVRVRYTPRLGRVKSVEVVARTAADEVVHQSPADVVVEAQEFLAMVRAGGERRFGDVTFGHS